LSKRDEDYLSAIAVVVRAGTREIMSAVAQAATQMVRRFGI
jgi:hypothetical protein